MKITDTQHFRKTTAGIAMVAAPLFALVGAVLYPPLSVDEGKLLASVADNRTRFTVGALVATISIPLMLIAMLGLVHLVRDRRPGLAHLGGGLIVVGLVGVSMLQGYDFVIAQMVRGDADNGEMTALLARMMEDGTVVPGIMTMFAVLGFVVLAVAAWRAHVLPVLPALFVGVSALVTAAGYATATNEVIVGGWVLMVLGLGATGVTVLTETDEEWEHAPEVHGLWAMPAHM